MTRLLFVCLGNICRSPAAEAIMNKFVADAGLDETISCDSAGTSAHHVGERADPRMRRHASHRDYKITSKSRGFEGKDFERFDLILAMDRRNFEKLKSQDKTSQHHTKIRMMTDYCTKMTSEVVPDPYFGGEEGFELVLDILEDSCAGLLDELKQAKS